MEISTGIKPADRAKIAQRRVGAQAAPYGY